MRSRHEIESEIYPNVQSMDQLKMEMLLDIRALLTRIIDKLYESPRSITMKMKKGGIRT
jgi:hypothetical protein